MRETESLLIAARINKTQQNSWCRLCGYWDETINHIISESSKLAQKDYKTRYDWVGKIIYRELCEKIIFDYMNKWYMHNPESVLENDTHKLWWDFDIQTDHLISTRRSDLIIINHKKERNCKIVDFAVPTDHRIKLKENKKKDKYLNLARELKKTVEHESDNYTNHDWCFWYSHQRIKGVDDLEIKGRVENIQTTTLWRSARILRKVLDT